MNGAVIVSLSFVERGYLRGCLIITGELLLLARCEIELTKADGGCGARPFVLDAVLEGEDSEAAAAAAKETATAAAIDGDEATVALGESCDCTVALFVFKNEHKRLVWQYCNSMFYPEKQFLGLRPLLRQKSTRLIRSPALHMMGKLATVQYCVPVVKRIWT